MTIREYRTRSALQLGVACLLLLLGINASSQGVPAQSPLLSRSGGGVSPNLVLDMDDSGSMGYQHLPESRFTVAGKSIAIAGNYSLLMHPLDTKSSTNYKGIWPADTTATGAALLYQQQVRSPDVNSLYYNPETTFLPWANVDGTRFPVAVPEAVAFDPLSPATPAGTVKKPYFVATGSKDTRSNGNTTPGLPAGWAQNDFVICLAESIDGVSHTTTSVGWSQIYNRKGSDNNHSASAFYKLAGATLTAPTIIHTGTGSSNIVSQCYAYRNVDLTTPFDVAYAAGASSTSNSTSDDTIETGSIATTTVNTLVLMTSHQADDFSTLTVGTNGGLAWTQAGRSNNNGSGSNVAVALWHADKAAVGGLGPLLVDSDKTDPNTGVLLALRAGSANVAVPLSNGVNLSAATSNITATWCATAPPATAYTPACSSSSKSYTPMLFYRLKKSSGVYMDPTVSANYDSYDLTNNLKNGAASAAPQTYPKRTDCPAGVCDLDLERINYANWWQYHRSRMLVAQSAVAESFWNMDESKLRVGWGYINKGPGTVDGESVSTVVQGVRDFSTARKNLMFDFMRKLDPSGSTPLPAALAGVGEYYTKDSPWADDPGDSSVKIPAGSEPKSCRRAYHLLVTDGLWSSTGSTIGNYDGDTSKTFPTITSSGNTYTYVPKPPFSDSNSNYLADYASYYFNRDLRPTMDNNVQPSAPGVMFWQGMVNFVVGVGLAGTLNPATDLDALTHPTAPGGKVWGTNKVDDLWHAAVNSEGRFFAANDASQLAASLTSALTTTLQNELREAGVATASTTLADGNRKYIPLYKTGVWTGDVRAFELDGNGATKIGPGPDGELWSASSQLPPWADRNIYTWNESSGAASPFTWAGMGALNQSAIGPATATSGLVDYLRGDATNEGGGYRTRKSRLGDFINSNPVMVKSGVDLKYQSLSVGGGSYDSYRASKALRNGVLFVGANDGMLHAFKDAAKSVAEVDDGKEIFAYVPRAVYPNLSILSDVNYGTTALYHQFYVDGALSETDAYLSSSWRNYVLGSLSAGGRGVFAIDATDMTAPSGSNVKWEFFNDSDLGYVSAPVEVGVLPSGSWVAIFGNGPSSPSGKAVLFVLDLESGAAQKLVVDAGPSNGLGGIGVLRDSSGYITNLYAGDLKGALWKLDYDAAAGAPHFVVSASKALFQATTSGGAAQAITQAPLVYSVAAGGNMIVFGTGKLLVDADALTTDTQSMYGVWDMAPAVDTTPRPMGRGPLFATRQITRTVGANGAIFYGMTGSAISSSQRGWVVDLTVNVSGTDGLLGQRIIYPPLRASSGLVLFSAVAPAPPATVCSSAEGVGANFVVPVATGLNPTIRLFDTNGDGYVTALDDFTSGYATKVDGIDAIVSSGNGDVGTPPSTGGPEVGEGDGQCPKGQHRAFIANTTGGQFVCLPDDECTTNCGGGGTGVIKDRIWRRIVNPPIR